MTYQRGDVVIVDVPFVSRPGSKMRPMVVVQNDRNNARMANTILATVTTNTARAKESTQVSIAVRSADGRQTGLIADSVISCENLLTIDQSNIRRKIGQLTPSLIQQLNAALKESLDLP